MPLLQLHPDWLLRFSYFELASRFSIQCIHSEAISEGARVILSDQICALMNILFVMMPGNALVNKRQWRTVTKTSKLAKGDTDEAEEDVIEDENILNKSQRRAKAKKRRKNKRRNCLKRRKHLKQQFW
ncbi:hypothetical protein F2Q70_00044394 [Brassica cretica]|uniref:Uncharacterized protein n=1 Tax=Brassica cretica TaxID=69181 RepID=A0A8S9KIW9_BRACR|nr:hypothetical protein F2Q70_00044394 [Brassica cretica]KAF2606185.1 hypothetical protein F2Q68_00045346 [Brassica cretica]